MLTNICLLLCAIYAGAYGQLVLNCALFTTAGLTNADHFGCVSVNGSAPSTMTPFWETNLFTGDINSTDSYVCDRETVKLMSKVLSVNSSIQSLTYMGKTLDVLSNEVVSCVNGTVTTVVVATSPSDLQVTLDKKVVVESTSYCGVVLVNATNYPAVTVKAGNCSSNYLQSSDLILRNAAVISTLGYLDAEATGYEWSGAVEIYAWDSNTTECVSGLTDCSVVRANLKSEGQTALLDLINTRNLLTNRTDQLTAADSALVDLQLKQRMAVISLNSSIIAGGRPPLNSSVSLAAAVNESYVMLTELSSRLVNKTVEVTVIRKRAMSVLSVIKSMLTLLCPADRTPAACNLMKDNLDLYLDSDDGNSSLVESQEFLEAEINNLLASSSTTSTSSTIDDVVSDSDSSKDSEFTLPIILALSIGGAAALMVLVVLGISLAKGCKRKNGKFVTMDN